MQTVYLNGDIAKFGSTWNVNCSTVPEIFKLIDCQTPGFREHLIEAAENGVAYEIRRGEEFVDEDTLFLSLGKEDIIITEVPAGAKSGGAKLIIGAIILTALFFPFAGPGMANIFQQMVAAGGVLKGTAFAAAAIGVNLALSGLTQMLAPGPEVDNPETNESYLFNGPVNTTKQGVPVPVAYGELIVGGAPISVNYSTTKFGRNPFPNLGARFPQDVRDALGSAGSGNTGEDACFTEECLVTMADGSKKNINLVIAGDEILGQEGPAEVLENNAVRTTTYLYSINESTHFVTDSHPFLTEAGWKAFNARRSARLHPELNITQLQKGDVLVKESGTEVLQTFSFVEKTLPVFNLNVTGNDTYIVNDYIVHNK